MMPIVLQDGYMTNSSNDSVNGVLYMQGFNLIAVFDESCEKVLMCKRKNEPYKDLLNFVGGKIEQNEDGLTAAYRELFEETNITKDDIFLTHLMDFKYHLNGFYLEVYAGRLNKHIDAAGDENELFWIALNQNFFDTSIYAGDGNIGHIMRHIELRKKDLLGI